MAIFERKPLEMLRTKFEEVRAVGVLPTVRTRVEEIVTRVKERTEITNVGLTRENSTGSTGGNALVSRRKNRGL